MLTFHEFLWKRMELLMTDNSALPRIQPLFGPLQPMKPTKPIQRIWKPRDRLFSLPRFPK